STGSAYVFFRTGVAWNQEAKLTASDAASEDYFGWSVAVSGDTVVAGAIRDDAKGVDAGAAYIYVDTTVADLLISLGVDKTSVKQGDTLTYTITIKNFGPNQAHNVLVNDTLDSGATFVSAQSN